MASVDYNILQILIDCECSQYGLKFAGLGIEKLYNFTLEDFIRILSNEADEEVARRLYEQVQRSRTQKEQEESKEDDEVQILHVIVRNEGQPVTVKEETIEVDNRSDQEEADSNRPTVIEYDRGHSRTKEEKREDADVQILDVVVKNKDQPVTVNEETIEVDDQEEARQDSNRPCSSSESTENDDSEDEFEISPKIYIAPKKPNFFKLKKYDNVQLEITYDSTHNCSTNHPTAATVRRWTRGMSKWGSKMHSITMSTWIWQELTSLCPYNLFKILVEFCPTLHELILTANINQTTDQHQMLALPQNFKLPKLKVIRLCHNGHLTCLHQLKEILVAAVDLREIYYSFGIHDTATSFLEMLRGLTKDQLKSLKVLSIKPKYNDSCLNQVHFIHLANIEAAALEELELGNGIWEDVDGSTIQEMLLCLPKLKKLTIDGCFKGSSKVKPKMLIKFPQMNSLESIKIGSNYSYNYDNYVADPRIHPLKFRKGPHGARINDSTSEPTISSFPVTLQFPILPSLDFVQLGNMFEIKDLHFANFTKLKKFFVGSRWDLTVSFPNQDKSRRSSYPLVTELKIPDCLDNPTFVKLIPLKFPNLTYCTLSLPTVKVLRTFFKEMSNSQVKTLRLETQFDFASTLDTCLLDKPTTIQVSEAEKKKVELLKEYKHWEEYVKFHHIELPEEDLSSLEQDDMAGLSSLKNLTILRLVHDSRILRIPKGNLHWTSPDCQFTEEATGFREYSWSASCEQLRNDLIKKNLKDDRYLRYYNPFRCIRDPDNLIYDGYQVGPRKIIMKNER